MKNLNIEIKARVSGHGSIRTFLLRHGADFRGTDRQVDTYFTVSNGRLKIREGTIESCIVHYSRPDEHGPKRCDYLIEKYDPGDPALARLKELLTASLGVLAVVDKQREIYFIDNVKFHLDTVDGLGEFFEIEAIGSSGRGEEALRRQCEDYLTWLGIPGDNLIHSSYSDMVLKRTGESDE